MRFQRGDVVEDVALDDFDEIKFGSGASRKNEPRASARADVRSSQTPGAAAWFAANESGSSPDTLFHLADGGRLPGYLIDPPEPADALFARTALGETTKLPFEHLAAVQLADAVAFPRADEVLRAALNDRPAAEDVFITRETEDIKAPRGRLESLGVETGSFAFGGRSRGFSTEKAYAVVFAAGPAGAAGERFPMTISLSDGSIFSGSLERGDAETLSVSTSLGLSATVPISAVARLNIFSDRVVYLSDLTPVGERVEGVLHRPWPVRMDRNAAGGPLSIDGRSFEKGVGVHSRTELTYELGGRFEKFASSIGLDDAVRPRGSVVFRVSADGKVVFDSGLVTGADASRDVVLPVIGAKTMTLTVDYGDAVDLADQADWADARLIKPSAAKP